MPRNMLKYSENEIICTLADRAQTIFNNMSKNDFNLLCYLLNPRGTAIGAGKSYNEQTITDFVYDRCNRIAKNTPNDGNSDFTLNYIIKAIKDGEL